MPVLISNLWTPDIWIAQMQEKQATFPSVFNSKAIMRTPELDAVASGAGVTANIPYFNDITDQTDEVQVENTGPGTDNGGPGGKMVGTILNRVTKNSVTALSGAVSGSDPLGNIINQMVARRLKQRNTTLVNILKGLFNAAGTVNAAAPLAANRYGTTTAEIFLEAGAAPAVGQMVSPDVFIYTCALLGEIQDVLANGVFLCHPNVKARLQSLDSLNFKTTIMPSELPFEITTYRGVPIVTSAALVRNGSTSGFVYDSYLVASGAIGYGEKPQAGDIVDVASLQYWRDPDKNNELIYDRTRFVLHPSGMKWVGTPAGQSATNAELATPANWNLAWQTANRVSIACFRTNG